MIARIVVLSLIGMSYERKKNARLKSNLEVFFIRLNELGRVLNYPFDVNFHFQKSLEIFDKKSGTKNLIQKGQGVEGTLPHAN